MDEPSVIHDSVSNDFLFIFKFLGSKLGQKEKLNNYM